MMTGRVSGIFFRAFLSREFLTDSYDASFEAELDFAFYAKCPLDRSFVSERNNPVLLHWPDLLDSIGVSYDPRCGGGVQLFSCDFVKMFYGSFYGSYFWRSLTGSGRISRNGTLLTGKRFFFDFNGWNVVSYLGKYGGGFLKLIFCCWIISGIRNRNLRVFFLLLKIVWMLMKSLKTSDVKNVLKPALWKRLNNFLFEFLV